MVRQKLGILFPQGWSSCRGRHVGNVGWWWWWCSWLVLIEYHVMKGWLWLFTSLAGDKANIEIERKLVEDDQKPASLVGKGAKIVLIFGWKRRREKAGRFIICLQVARNGNSKSVVPDLSIQFPLSALLCRGWQGSFRIATRVIFSNGSPAHGGQKYCRRHHHHQRHHHHLDLLSCGEIAAKCTCALTDHTLLQIGYTFKWLTPILGSYFTRNKSRVQVTPSLSLDLNWMLQTLARVEGRSFLSFPRSWLGPVLPQNPRLHMIMSFFTHLHLCFWSDTVVALSSWPAPGNEEKQFESTGSWFLIDNQRKGMTLIMQTCFAAYILSKQASKQEESVTLNHWRNFLIRGLRMRSSSIPLCIYYNFFPVCPSVCRSPTG